MSAKKYNGWTNYETWCVHLWITNDPIADSNWGEVAQECWDDAASDGTFTREELARIRLADRLREDHIDRAGDCMTQWFKSSVFGDLLQASLSEVNWEEIARSFMQNVDKTGGEAATQ